MRLDGHEFEQAPGVGDGQGSLACCSSWGRKELDMTSGRTELNRKETSKTKDSLLILDLSLDGRGCWTLWGLWITEVWLHLPWVRCPHWEQGVWRHEQCPQAAKGLWPALGCLVFVSQASPCLLTKKTQEILAENAVLCCPAEMTTSRRAEGGRGRKAKRKVFFQA